MGACSRAVTLSRATHQTTQSSALPGLGACCWRHCEAALLVVHGVEAQLQLAQLGGKRGQLALHVSGACHPDR